MWWHQEEATEQVTGDVETMEAALDQMASAFIQKELRREYLEDLEFLRSGPTVKDRLSLRERETVLRTHYRQLGLRVIPDA